MSRPPMVYSLRLRGSFHYLCYEQSYFHLHDRICKEVVQGLRRKQFRDIGVDIVLTLTGRQFAV